MPRIFSLILLIGLLGAPLRAQDPPQLQYAQPVEGSLAPDQTDTFTWIGSAGDRPVIVMNAKGGEIDPLLRLYNPAGQLIGEDQDSNGKRNARIENLVLAESGTYIVEARNAGPGGGAYSLIIHERDQVIHYHGGDEVPYTGEVAGHDHDHAYHYELSRPWPDTHITYTIVNTLPGFEESAVREVIVYGLQAWANNTPLTFQEVDDQNAHIVIQFDRIDGSSQVLGQACPPSSPCAGSVVFDSEENWVLYEPTRYDDISLLGVATHEFGHALGLLHSDDASALMYPSYSPYVLQPTDDDIRGIQRLYGSGRGTVYNPTSVPGASGSDGQPVVQGTISDDQFVHFWDFDAYAGEVITIRMEARSGGLDPFIFILDANDQILAYDDDSGPDQDAIVRNITFPFDGTYTVAATRYQQVFGYSVGDYRLTITYGATEAPPDDDEDRDSERPSPFPTPGPRGDTGAGSVRISAGDERALREYPLLSDVLDRPFTDSRTPRTQRAAGVVDRAQAYIWALNWCASDRATLETNLASLSVAFLVDGREIDGRLITEAITEGNGLSCALFFVLVSDWTGDQTELTATLRLNDAVYDGQRVYGAGDYVYQYDLTIEP